MRRFASTSKIVRVVAIGVAVLGHLFVLLLLRIEWRMHRPEAAAEQLLFVSIWPDPQPPQPPPQPPRRSPPRPPPTRVAPAAVVITPAVTPPEPLTTPAPVVLQPVAPESVLEPPIDSNEAIREAAKRYIAEHYPPDMQGAVADSNVPVKPCRPPAISKEMQAKMDALLPRPADPGPPVTSPPGSVMINGQRVGTVELFTSARSDSVTIIPPEVILGERRSSVPDPHTCD